MKIYYVKYGGRITFRWDVCCIAHGNDIKNNHCGAVHFSNCDLNKEKVLDYVIGHIQTLDYTLIHCEVVLKSLVQNLPCLVIVHLHFP